MNTGQVLMTILAFMFLGTVVLNFNQTGSMTMDSVQYAQSAILMTTVATSYGELARGLSFGSRSDTMYVIPTELYRFTPPSELGPDDSTETSVERFNDFDDFNGFTFEKEIPGSGKKFKTHFRVCYVDPFDINVPVNTQTLTKRLDLQVWQSSPPLANPTAADTLKTFFILGYYHYQ